MHRLLRESEKVKAQATKILEESGVIEILQSYGEVKIGGSYALDTMLRPDIDLFVVTGKHDWEKVLQIQTKIMRTKYFREFDFVNWVDFEDKNLETVKGYYFQPWVPKGGQLWMIDIWLITPEYDETTKTTEHFKKLLEQSDESKKTAILEIKEAMRQGKKYVKGVDGRRIYQAVLEGGITTPKEFETFLQTRK
jgi:hypothetical protein